LVILADGTVSKVTIVPFYDRSGLIHETLDTLKTALSEEILITVTVVLVTVMHLRSSVLIGGLLGTFQVFQWLYPLLLRIFLRWKLLFLTFPLLIVIGRAMVWLGVPKLTGWLPDNIRRTKPMMGLAHSFPGLGREFMPALDEGSFLYMPTTMPHAGLTEVQEVLATQDRAITAIPEVESAVGKLGRAETPLDPAPLSMIETIINYHPEYLENEKGERLLFQGVNLVFILLYRVDTRVYPYYGPMLKYWA